MKILSTTQGDALLSNAEVMQWLRDSKIDAPDNDHETAGSVPPPENAREIGKQVLDYFARSPAANQTIDSVKSLYQKLEKYQLSDPELVMIANIRPEAYAQLVPLIIDAHNRFNSDTIWEILEAVKSLEPRPNNDQAVEHDGDGDGDGDDCNGEGYRIEGESAHENNEQGQVDKQNENNGTQGDEMDTSEGVEVKTQVRKEEVEMEEQQ